MIDESHDSRAESVQDYRLYIQLLGQTSLQRSLSNYFFILLNAAIILIQYVYMPRYIYGIQNAGSMLVAVPQLVLVSFVGIVLCSYWAQEMRESYIVSEVRYRTLMELESEIFERGLLNREWNNLGGYTEKRSPVFFVSFARFLPKLFIVVHLADILLLVVAILSLRH